MKKNLVLIISISLLLSGCAPHIHLDFLGEEKVQEVVLIKSPAKEKILILDVAASSVPPLIPVYSKEKEISSPEFITDWRKPLKIRGLKQ